MTAQTRDKKLHYLNTGTLSVPVWTQINTGFTDFVDSLNPETEDTQYIGEGVKTTSLKAYAPQVAYTMKLEYANAIVKKLHDIAESQLVGEQVEIIHVDTYRTSGASYVAFKGNYNVIPDNSFGGAAGEVMEMTGNLSQIGDLVEGLYNPSTKAFTETISS